MYNIKSKNHRKHSCFTGGRSKSIFHRKIFTTFGKNLPTTNRRDGRKPTHDTAETKPAMVRGYFNRFLKIAKNYF